MSYKEVLIRPDSLSYSVSKDEKKGIDWLIFFSALFISIIGLITINSFSGDNHLFIKQSISTIISLIIFFIVYSLDIRIFNKSWVVTSFFSIATVILISLFVFGAVARGSQSWFQFGGFAFQPADIVKLILIILLAKYFSRRHKEIANIKHIIVSGIYAFILFFLVLIQPDFGSAVIVFAIWFLMVFVSGISKKHLLAVTLIMIASFICLWFFVFKDYQKDRIKTFVNPLSDIHGAGYNARQSMIAIGSGELWGKGIGYGTQSRLRFLPEYQTDFIFAAFAEEWGFVGVIILLFLYGFLIFRILKIASYGATNLEILICLGVAIYFIIHIFINIGMNLVILPVTGTPLPFMSYGGSHLLAEWIALAMVMGTRRTSRIAHKEAISHEFIGPV